MSKSNNFESAFALPFKKLQIEEEKEEAPIQFEVEEDECLKQPAALIIPLNVPSLSEEPAAETQNNTLNQQISLPLVFANNAFSTFVIEKEEEEDPKSPGVASLEIEDESECQSQNHKSYAPSPQVSAGSPFNPDKVNKKQSSALKQPHCFLNFDIASSDKESEVASQTESASDKPETSLGGQKDKSEGKENSQNSTKKQISPFICVKTLLMKKSPFMHLKKQMKKSSQQKHTHTNMQMLSADSTKSSNEPPSGPQLEEEAEM